LIQILLSDDPVIDVLVADVMLPPPAGVERQQQSELVRQRDRDHQRALLDTGGSFRLLNRLLTQTERILEINSLREVNKEVVDAARESLVIGQA
jgi:hypothetical protein